MEMHNSSAVALMGNICFGKTEQKADNVVSNVVSHLHSCYSG